MCFQYTNLLSLCLVFLWPAASLSCYKDAMLVCLHHEELRKASYSILFTQPFTNFMKTCREQETFFGCAFLKEQTTGCSYGDLVEEHAMSNVHQAVCGDNMAAYNRSRPCILLLEADVRKCYRPFRKTKYDHCQELMGVRECIQTKIQQKPECSSEDMRFVGKVIDSGLKPYAHSEVHNCDMAIFGDGEETTTQAQQITSMIYAEIENSNQSTMILAETSESAANANVSTKVVQERKEPVETHGESLASTGENGSNRRFLSVDAVVFTVLTWLSVCSFHVY